MPKKKLEDFLRMSGVGDKYTDEIVTCLKNNGYRIEPCIYKGDHRGDRILHLSMMMLNKYLHILEKSDESEKLVSYWNSTEKIDSRIRGDIHVHTVFSDGMGTVNDLAAEAVKAGYSWIAFADHSPARGNDYRLTDEKFIERHDRIIEAEETFSIKIYESIEADISQGGDLLFPDKWRDHLDYIIVSLHERIENYSKALKRIERAVSSSQTAVFAHPFSGLQQNYDLSYILDLLDVLEESGTAVEFNLSPQYIPFNFLLAEKCRKRDVLKAFSTDSHFVDNIRFMRLASMYLLEEESSNVLNFLDKLPINEKSF